MLKMFDFECSACSLLYEELVDTADSESPTCPSCGLTQSSRVISPFKIFTTIVPSYPGAKKVKAGYVHTHGDRPAEKAGRQVTVPIKIGK